MTLEAYRSLFQHILAPTRLILHFDLAIMKSLPVADGYEKHIHNACVTDAATEEHTSSQLHAPRRP